MLTKEIAQPATPETAPVTRTVMVGVGGMARHHLPSIIHRADTQIVAICEPSPISYAAAAKVFEDYGLPVPPNQPDLELLLSDYASEIDAAFIITPHVLHHAQTLITMQAGIDVLLEKPMVMNAAEARDLIATQEQTGRLLVVAFNGSLSPQIRHAAQILRAGELGRLHSISATVWQNWRATTTGTWRQEPTVSGGGFLFDTGAHMLNTVVDLAGEPITEVMAFLDNQGAPVDIQGAVVARLQSGALITMNASGDVMPAGHNSMGSEVYVFCSQGMIRTGIWGEHLAIRRLTDTALMPQELPATTGAWEQFLRVRNGEIANPCPPQVGLRMALLWDAIQTSAANNGQPVIVAAE